jgi:hypothetical protein
MSKPKKRKKPEKILLWVLLVISSILLGQIVFRRYQIRSALQQHRNAFDTFSFHFQEGNGALKGGQGVVNKQGNRLQMNIHDERADDAVYEGTLVDWGGITGGRRRFIPPGQILFIAEGELRFRDEKTEKSILIRLRLISQETIQRKAFRPFKVHAHQARWVFALYNQEQPPGASPVLEGQGPLLESLFLLPVSGRNSARAPDSPRPQSSIPQRFDFSNPVQRFNP